MKKAAHHSSPPISGALAIRFATILWLALLAAVFSGIAIAQTASATVSGQAQDLRGQLDAEKKAAAVIENSPNYASDAPPTATEEELKLRRYYVTERVRALEAQLRGIKRRDELSQQLERTRQLANNWTQLEQKPPYSVILIDQLAREKLAADWQIQSSETRTELIRATRDTLSETLKVLSVTVRQKEEQLSLANGAAKPGLAWLLELDRQHLRTNGEILRSVDIAQEINQFELAIARLSARLASRKADAARGEGVFAEKDYAQLMTALDDESKMISHDLSRAVDTEVAATRKLAQAVERLAQQQALTTREPPGAEFPARVEAFRHAVALAEIDVTAANTMLDVMRFKPAVLENKRTVWEYRYRLYQDRSPQRVAEIATNLSGITDRLVAIVRVLDRQKAVLASDMTDKEQLALTVGDANKRELLNRALKYDAEWEKSLRQVSAFLGSTQYLISRVGEELGSESRGRRWRNALASAYYFTSGMLQSAWNLELLAIEDTIEMDGRKVSAYTSITVGKVLRAVVLFVGGVFLALWLSRLAETFVVRRFGYDPAQASILRKWINTVGLGILLIAVLIWVRIPLTVFAFLGGAVAIGLGFGMQNLLKNLISGLMLLFERPFRAGDLIEVGPIRGNIVEIGIRSSVIRDANGVDTLIPNNTFVEQSVTNWTYESAMVRFCIRVGVAYGSPVREVAQLLAECVGRHNLVLKAPEPEILFENFGADSLEFAIYYWLEIGPSVSNRIVSSDLRFIMEKVLRENDISISYPQRDVHLDISGPLKVEIAKSE